MLDVYVDDMDTPYEGDVSTVTSANRYASYTLKGLENAKHTVKVVVKSGTLNIDALYTLGTKLDADDSLLVSVQDDTLPQLVLVKAGEKAEGLPDQVKVLTASGEIKEMDVTWDAKPAQPDERFVQTTIKGTIEGGKTVFGTELTVSVPIVVIPKNLQYFANMSKDPVSSDYTAIMEMSADTLLHTAENHDQAYSEETGFGYLGTGGTLRDTTADMFESMRYAGKGETITYQFDVEPGEYNVYVGMFDPSGWYGSHNGGRYADITINEDVVQEGYQYLNNVDDTLTYEKITVGDDGKLTVAVSPTEGAKEAIQVSFIAVAQYVEETTEPAGKPDKSQLEDLISQMENLDLSGYTEESVSVFNEAFAAAKATLEDETLTEADQSKVDEAAAALQEAYDGLEKIQGGGDEQKPGGDDEQKPGGDDEQKPGTGNEQKPGTGNDQKPGSGSDSADAGKDSVKTGDNSMPMLAAMVILLAISSGCVVVLLRRRFR